MLAICYFVLPPSSILLGVIQIEAVVTKELSDEFLLDLNSHPITEKQTNLRIRDSQCAVLMDR
jgi:hypothetical protein